MSLIGHDRIPDQDQHLLKSGAKQFIWPYLIQLRKSLQQMDRRVLILVTQVRVARRVRRSGTRLSITIQMLEITLVNRIMRTGIQPVECFFCQFQPFLISALLEVGCQCIDTESVTISCLGGIAFDVTFFIQQPKESSVLCIPEFVSQEEKAMLSSFRIMRDVRVALGCLGIGPYMTGLRHDHLFLIAYGLEIIGE